jgi:hypothetical protein
MLFDTEESAPKTDVEVKFRSGVDLTDAEWRQLKKIWKERRAQEREQRKAQETPKQKAQREWAEIRAATDEFLRESAETLGIFRERLTALFDAMRADKEPFQRRPNISLRLIALGDPPAKVITLPSVRHDRTGGYLVTSRHTIELMEKTSIQVKGKDADQFRRKLNFNNSPDLPSQVGTIYKTALDDARRTIATIRDFLDDSRAVLARGCDHCCICGRALTDELSRSRGIGPECILKADVVAVLTGPGHVIVPGLIEPEFAAV